MQLKERFFKIGFLYRLIPLKFLMKLSSKKVVYPFYHHVMHDDDKSLITSNLYQVKKKSEFLKDLKFLKKHLISLSINDLVNNLNHDNGFYFLLSFDDGLSSFYQTIAPILEEESIKAINFVNTDFLDNRELFFRYKVNLIIDKLKHGPISDSQKKEVQKYINYNVSHTDDFILKLKALKYQDIIVINHLCVVFEINIVNFLKQEEPYMNSKQVAELINKGFNIGSHSASHPYYSELLLKDQIAETEKSINFLKEKFELEKVHFAFPFSDELVSTNFFNTIDSDIITFGTAGMKDEELGIRNIQRIPMEYGSVYSAETIIKGELIFYIAKKILRRNQITRTQKNHPKPL
jgi:peptidoglycan/xylan/chitin deacetylase (PgdA/CDA1 family)|tara:strand:+ start:793 stop:1839 length:1047 start_codon:yes stop_codon:yes gene_type:complete